MIARLHDLRRNAYVRVAFFLGLAMLPMVAARVGIFIAFYDDFANLQAWEVAAAFIVGLRFDASIAIMAVGIPLLLLLLPFAWAHHLRWQRFWGGVIYLMLLSLVFLSVADAYYFAVVHRHAGAEVASLASDIPAMINLALHDYPWALTVFILLSWLGARKWRGLLTPIPEPPKNATRRWLGIVIFILFAVFVGRGGLQYKPLNVADAFFTNSFAAGYLALNGPFSLAHSLELEIPVVKDFMPRAEAVRITREWLSSPGEQFSQEDYPLSRTSLGHARVSTPNIVVLLLESWDASNVDVTRILRGKRGLGVTPNFDALARQGRLYTNFFASGQRSIEGIAAMIGGVPNTPGMPNMGLGMEQNRLSFLGELAKSQGYQTIFLQSSNRGSFHVDAIAARAGFDTYLGAEDIPEAHSDKLRNAGWGAWDHSTLQAADRLFSGAQKPFLGFIFTSSTHTPFQVPTEKWKKFSADNDREKFWNTIFYADWALGEFFAAAKKSGYFDNTIFILTGDHASQFIDDAQEVPNRFRIPMLLVGPGISPGVDQRVGGQLDVIPTLIDAADWRVPHAAFGRSLLDDSRPDLRAAFSVRATLIDWIASDGWISHDLNRRVGASVGLSNVRADDMEIRLTAAFQVISHALAENRLMPLQNPP